MAFIDLILSLGYMVLRVLTIVCLLRFLFEFLGVSRQIPLVTGVISATNNILGPVRKVVPRAYRFDTASLVIAWILASASSLLLAGRESFALIQNLLPALWLGAVEVLYFSTWIFLIATIATVVISWFNPQSGSPNVLLVQQIAYPLHAPIRRFLPNLGGLDFSSVIVLLLLVTILRRVIPALQGLIA